MNVITGERSIVQCANCGAAFCKRRGATTDCEQHFCSWECYKEYRKENSESELYECDNPECDVEFIVHPYELEKKDHHFCSRECYKLYVKKNGGLS